MWSFRWGVVGVGLLLAASAPTADAQVRLSWSLADQVSDLQMSGTDDVDLFVVYDEPWPPESISFQLGYAASDEGCLAVRRCSDDAEAGCYRVVTGNELAGEPTLEGVQGFSSFESLHYVRIPLRIVSDCIAMEARFFLSHVAIVHADGTVDNLFAESYATINGGLQPRLVPTVHNASFTGSTSGLVWARVDNADGGTTFELWSPQSGFVSSTDVEQVSSDYFRVQFTPGLVPEEPFFLVAGDEQGRRSRLRVDLKTFENSHFVGGGGGQFATIQSAIDHAKPGDRIVVSPGTYEEQLLVDKAVWIESEFGSSETTIDARNLGPAVTIDVNEVSPIGLVGFSIENGGEPTLSMPSLSVSEIDALVAQRDRIGGGGVRVTRGSSAYVSGCEVRYSSGRVDGNDGFGSGFASAGLSIFEDCIFEENAGTAAGGGGFIETGTAAVLVDCEFSKNSGGFVGGGLVVSGRVAIVGGSFLANRAQQRGGGVEVGSNGRLIAVGTSFEENSVFYGCRDGVGNNSESAGGAMSFRNASRLDALEGCYFKANRACAGGAIYFSDGSSRTIVDNVFEGNTARIHGGAIYAAPPEVPNDEALVVLGSLFVNNRTADNPSYGSYSTGGGALLVHGVDLEVAQCTFQSNEVVLELGTVEAEGGAILYVADAPRTAEIRRSEFVDNLANEGAVLQIDALTGPPRVALNRNVFAHSLDGEVVEQDGGGALSMGEAIEAECNVFWGNEMLFDPSLIGACTWLQDPLFCSAGREELVIDESSICLTENQPGDCLCGDIGLAEIGCSRTVRESHGDLRELEVGVRRDRGAIEFQVNVPSGQEDLSASLFDAGGRLVRRLEPYGSQDGSTLRYTWSYASESRDRVPSGVYFLQVRSSESKVAEKLVVVR